MINENGKTLAAVVSEAKDDLIAFLDTRLQMLRSEISQKLSVLKISVPMIIMAAMLGWAGFMLLSIALVAAIGSAVGWGWAFLIVGVVYSLTAATLGFIAYRELSQVGVAPKRTINVLKQDKAWLTSEARTQL
ncbi:MAG: phage holin family protein [Acidobacteriaceae bacterium]|nr:phage holin family protein [Acidobacteriaceae bacterium]